MEYPAVVELAVNDIWAAMVVVRRQSQQAEEGVTEAMYAECAVALVYAYLLTDREDFWKHCASQAVWNGRTLDRSDALLISFKVVNEAFHGLLYERIRFHAKALREAFRMRVPPESLKDYIRENHGLRRLHDAELARERGCHQEKDCSPEDEQQMPGSMKSEDDDGLLETRKLDAPHPLVGQNGAAGGSRKVAPKRWGQSKKQSSEGRYPTGTANRKVVEILVDLSLFDRLMTIGGRRILLEVVKRENGASKFVRLEAEEVEQ